jgi:serine/threonine protein phosphatase 1
MLAGMMSKTPPSRWELRPPTLPRGTRIYAVGDIHGRADLLDATLQRIRDDVARHPISRPVQVFLGDYIDRGPASRQVLDCLSTQAQPCETIFLRGNHEAYLCSFLKNPQILATWRHYGGLETLLSYSVTPTIDPDPTEQAELSATLERLLPPFHREWFATLRDYFICGDFFFVHAGVRPGVPLERQSSEDLLWIREDFLNCKEDFPKMIVHGHTPVSQAEFRPNRVNIDTGAYATGRLTCLVIEYDQMFLL